MFKKFKKTMPILLSVLLAVLPACSSTNPEAQSEKTEAAATEAVQAEQEIQEETDYLDSLPTENMNGESIRFIARHGTGGRINFPEESLTGETVNDSLYTRNDLLMSRYNVKIENNIVDSSGTLTSTTQTSIAAGEDAYDVIFADMADTARTLVVNNMLMDYSGVPTVDLSQRWWSQHNGDLSLGGKQFFPTGVITPQYFNSLYLMLFNQQLAVNYNVGDLYDLALEGRWTLDQLDSILAIATQDLNGDGQMDLDDQWSMVYDEVAGFAFYFGVGGKMTEFDEEGMPYLNIASDQVIDLVERLRSVVGDKEVCLRGEDYSKDSEQTIFREGRSLFVANTLFHVRTVYREMDNDYGFLPMPKYDENQKNYYSYAQPWSGTGVAIPVTNSKIDDTGLILEAMAYLSESYVRDSMFETTYKASPHKSKSQ